MKIATKEIHQEDESSTQDWRLMGAYLILGRKELLNCPKQYHNTFLQMIEFKLHLPFRATAFASRYSTFKQK